MIGQSRRKVVLSGASAGGVRAAINCDFVADKIRGFGFDTRVSCFHVLVQILILSA